MGRGGRDEAPAPLPHRGAAAPRAPARHEEGNTRGIRDRLTRELEELRRQVHAARLRWGDHVPDGPEYAETAEPERIRRREKSAPAWLVLGGRIMAATVPGAGSVPQVGPPRVARPVAARRAASAWVLRCWAARNRATE